MAATLPMVQPFAQLNQDIGRQVLGFSLKTSIDSLTVRVHGRHVHMFGLAATVGGAL